MMVDSGASAEGSMFDILPEKGDDGGYASGGWKSEDGTLSCGYSSFRGKRVSMEDFYDIKSSKVDGLAVCLFGIFDGHGGARAAEYLKEHLFENLLKHPEFIANTKLAISETYQQTDRDFLDSEKETFRDDGSTASAAVLVGNHLYVANVGDSRTIISKAGKAIPLSEDHKPNRSDERKRIESAGGVVMWTGTWRVGGVLAMSRAFGNRMLKQFVVAEPEIQDLEVDENLDLLVLASDGLWDVVPNEDAVSIAQSEDDPEGAARKLTETAFTRGSADNITCIVVKFHHAKAASLVEAQQQILESNPQPEESHEDSKLNPNEPEEAPETSKADPEEAYQTSKVDPGETDSRSKRGRFCFFHGDSSVLGGGWMGGFGVDSPTSFTVLLFFLVLDEGVGSRGQTSVWVVVIWACQCCRLLGKGEPAAAPAKNSDPPPRPGKPKLRLLLISTAALLVAVAVSAAIGAVVVRSRGGGGGRLRPSRAMSRACGRTRFPALCVDSLLHFPGAAEASEEELVHISVNMTLQKVGRALYSASGINNLDMDPHARSAYKDCLELLDDSVDLLTRSLSSVSAGLTQDVLTWLSAALTNQDTCTEGLDEIQNGVVKDQMSDRLKDLSEIVSNSLSIYAAGDDFSGVPIQNRRLMSEERGRQDFPIWLSRRDRALLDLAPAAIGADIVVSKDGGNGTVKTISEAIKKAPEHSSRRFIIHVRAGRYEEKELKLGRKKTNIMLIGDGKGKTVITDFDVFLLRWGYAASLPRCALHQGFAFGSSLSRGSSS
ncbi:Probable protein phosphatase 2C 76 [Striga hermonthica]|uniref:protein-serine/threonine phosphatase n=1 Tax=Striga hermonthica TaxID=68872 RepID=A0A9N7REP5_STRHE|nr:Probable protein phosphatase 2C 76 [Striga hermonthica]